MSTAKATRFPSTTPAAYQAMSRTQKADFRRKVKEAEAAESAASEKHHAADFLKFADGLAALVAQFPYIEFEVVLNYCKRHNKVLTDGPKASAARKAGKHV